MEKDYKRMIAKKDSKIRNSYKNAMSPLGTERLLIPSNTSDFGNNNSLEVVNMLNPTVRITPISGAILVKNEELMPKEQNDTINTKKGMNDNENP